MTEEFLEQLTFTPDVTRPLVSQPHTIVLGGMGGSGLAGEALEFLELGRSVYLHRDYGLPAFMLPDALYVAISYSGNTEETLDFAREALAAGVKLAVVTSGGALEAFAHEHQLPLALVPAGHAPRNALLSMIRALLALLGEEETLEALAGIGIPETLSEESEQDAHFLLQSVPLFYASSRNAFLARLAKLVVNESARTPAFMHVFPELNHNEMQSFDRDMPEGLEHLFRFFIFTDTTDDSRRVRRIEVFSQLMQERGRLVRMCDISSFSRTEALVHTWLRLIMVGRLLAQTRNIDPDTAPLVEEFKKTL